MAPVTVFAPPDRDRLEAVTDAEVGEFPRFARVRRRLDQPAVDDVGAATRDALASIPALAALEPGAEVAVTAGSRGITDIVTVLRTTVDWLRERDLDPFILPAMGSHGGATAEGQRALLAKLGITEESMGCEIRASMEVERIGEGSTGHPIFASTVALDADAVLLANRVKIHTDFVNGDVESGLHKMAVIGLGKQRGAEAAHNAATATSFREVLPEWGEHVVEHTPVVGGLAVVENGDEETALVEGVPADDLPERERALFERSKELFPTLPVDDLDLLVVDEMGKHISGTGMDTNVIGRMLIHGEPEPETPAITRVYVRSLTEKTDGNGLGIGLADFVHQDAVAALDATETYVNAITGSEPERGRIPIALPSDETALLAAYSTTGVGAPSEMRIARIRNTLEPNDLLVSEPVARDLEGVEGVTVGDPEPLAFEDGRFASGFDG